MASLVILFAILSAQPAHPPLSEVVLYALDDSAKPSRVPVTSDEENLALVETAVAAQNNAGLSALEAAGRLAWLPSGTRAIVLKAHAVQNEAKTKGSQSKERNEVRLIDGPSKDRIVWVAATQIRRLPPITGEIEIPEDRDLHTPDGLALTLLDRDKQAFRALVQAKAQAESAAKKLPKTSTHRNPRYRRVLNAGTEPVTNRFHLMHSEIPGILRDGRKYQWTTEP
jgi:hypothetical protein